MKLFLTLSLSALVLGAFVWGCSMTPQEAAPTAAATPMSPPASDLYPDADEVWVFAREEAEREEVAQARVQEVREGGDGRILREAPEVMGRPREDAGPIPGCGGLVTDDPATKTRIPVPLEHTGVQAEIRGTFTTVEVEQRFHNPFDTKIEAVYVFPLPEGAAVHDFLMKIGERTIRGIVRERAEAEQIYREAKGLGYVASLLTEERPNVFTQKVANIEPGKALSVSIRYFDTLPLRDGWYEFVFPMVVGPRFNPPGTTDGIGAAARGARGASGQATEVGYLAPGERSGHDIALALDLDAGAPIEDWQCRTHAVDAEPAGPGRMTLALKPADRIPDRDFVLRYRVAGEELRTSAVTARDEHGGYFALTLHPPAELDSLEREPIELVFVLDTSGSMAGRPLELSKRAMRRALASLDERDSFQVIRFDDRASSLAPAFLPATRANLERGRDFVDGLAADGGTMMINGIRAALSFPGDRSRQRIVAFLTDGYIGNETEILAEERRLLGSARVFSFGVGSSVNRYLMEALAREGRGVSAYVGLSDAAEEVMAAFLERIRRPALEHVELASPDLALEELHPAVVPDLFHGRPVTIVGRFEPVASGASGPRQLDVTGRVAGRAVRIPVLLDPLACQAECLPWIFGRARIASLSSELLTAEGGARSELQQSILTTALDYGLSSPFTAFVAVDSTTRTEGDHGVTVEVPVPVPEGVEYDTTVAGSRNEGD